MDSEQRRKRKRLGRSSSQVQFFTRRSLFLCFSLFVFLLFLSSSRWFSIAAASFRPVLYASSTTLSRLSSSASKSTLDSLSKKYTLLRIESRILFPDHLLFMVVGEFRQGDKLDCLYHKTVSNGLKQDIKEQTVLSIDRYDEFRSIARCPLPPQNYSVTTVNLRRGGEVIGDYQLGRSRQLVPSWEKVVYEAAVDGDTVVVFGKGLNLRPHRESNPTQFNCHFGLGNPNKNDGEFALATKAVAAAQEIIRCYLPASFIDTLENENGIRVTVSRGSANTRGRRPVILPSVARIVNPKPRERLRIQEKHELCACTMVWNQAAALREWIMYHAWLGVERWFIYDNNSNDTIEEVVEELNLQGYNVSRLTWPWIKTQEAGFSHCALKARDECKWVGFFDVDEFFYFPPKYRLQQDYRIAGRNALRSLIIESASSSSNSTAIAEIRTSCHNFGPSGLTSHPQRGVTVGYTCRLQNPERHKSFVRPDALDTTLLNVVHHFKLKEEFGYYDVPKSRAVINHYKYQVWETFRAKFFRRVATYVVDWQEAQNEGSKDRAPGLGTEAIEPPNWRLQFCEVWDTGLRDDIQTFFSDPLTGLLPWEKASA